MGNSRKAILHLVDVVKFRQKPFVDVGHLMDLIDGVATMECGRNGEDTLVRGIDQFLVNIFHVLVLKCPVISYTPKRREPVAYLSEPSELIVNRSNCLLDRLLKRSPDTHDFTNTLHATAQEPANAVELLQIPSRNLDDAVVQARLKTSAGHLCDRVLDLIQWDTETELSRDKSKGVSSGF